MPSSFVGPGIVFVVETQSAFSQFLLTGPDCCGHLGWDAWFSEGLGCFDALFNYV